MYAAVDHLISLGAERTSEDELANVSLDVEDACEQVRQILERKGTQR